jgi:hypothetical protein
MYTEVIKQSDLNENWNILYSPFYIYDIKGLAMMSVMTYGS